MIKKSRYRSVCDKRRKRSNRVRDRKKVGKKEKKSGFVGFVASLKRQSQLCRVFLSILLFGLLLTGCKKTENPETNTLSPAETNRLVDVAYQKQLKGDIDEQQKQVGERNAVLQQINAIEAKVREQLPEEVSEEDFKAACEKLPEWRDLQARRKVMNDGIQKQTEEMRRRIQKRIQAEGRKRLELNQQETAARKASKQAH